MYRFNYLFSDFGYTKKNTKQITHNNIYNSITKKKEINHLIVRIREVRDCDMMKDNRKRQLRKPK